MYQGEERKEKTKENFYKIEKEEKKILSDVCALSPFFIFLFV